MLVALVDHIDLAAVYNHLQSPEAGSLNVFLGTVRNETNSKPVVKLVFEAYDTMAVKEMNKIAATAKDRWLLESVVIVHVTGEKIPGEAVVAIGVASAHREAGFAACRFVIDELKKTVPIWKKEFYADNSVWVNAHP